MAPLNRVPWAPLAVAALAAYVFVRRWQLLAASPLPVGVDGYWYALQLRSLVEQGHLAYPSSPLFLYAAAPLAWIAEPIVAAKLAAALVTALAVVPAYALGRRLSGTRGGGLLAAALVATSGGSAYLSTEFVKEGAGLTLVLAALATLAVALERPTRGRIAAAVALHLAALATHKVAFALAVAFAVPPLVAAWLHAAPGSPSRRRLGLALAAGLVVASGLALVGTLAPGRIAGLPNLDLLARALRTRTDFSFAALNPRDRPAVELGGEIAWGAAIAVLALLVANRRLPALAIGPVLFAAAVALPWLDVSDPQGVAFRARLAAFVAFAPLAPLLGARLLARLPAPRPSLVLAALAAALLVMRPVVASEGVVYTHPALAGAVDKLAGRLPPDALLVVHERHVAFMAAWAARVEVRLRAPIPSERPQFRLILGADVDTTVASALAELRAHPPAGVPPPESLHPWHENGLILCAEPTYQALARALPPATRSRLESVR